MIGVQYVSCRAAKPGKDKFVCVSRNLQSRRELHTLFLHLDFGYSCLQLDLPVIKLQTLKTVWDGDILVAYYRRTHTFCATHPLKIQIFWKQQPIKGDIFSSHTKYWASDIPPQKIFYSRCNISLLKMLTGQNFLYSRHA
jgi:hypothetical protein